MIVKVDEKELFTLTDLQKKVIKNDILAEQFEDFIKSRMFYVVNHKYEQCFRRLKAEWEPKLAEAGVQLIPTNKDTFAEMVFAHPDYKDRSAREAESSEE